MSIFTIVPPFRLTGIDKQCSRGKWFEWGPFNWSIVIVVVGRSHAAEIVHGINVLLGRSFGLR